MEILLGDFNAKVGGEDIFKPAIGNESLHEISNDNGVKLVNFDTSKNITAKHTMFSQRNIHKYQPIYVETSVRNKCRCSFYCALLTLHVSTPIGGHLQVVCNTKNSKAVTVYVNGSVASVRTKANAF
jgi:hypothetical protein